MINNLKKPMAFILLLFFGYYLNAQNKLEITPYIGYNTPLGDFNDFAQNGFDFGLSSDYFFSEKFGIGFDFNQQINNTNNPFDFTRIPNEPSVYSIDKNQNGNWATSIFGIGPVYRFSHKKFTTDIYTKAGLSIINTPKYQTTFNYSELGLEKDLLTLGSEENITSFGLTSGIRFNYQISNSISLFVNPQYVYTTAKVDYTYVDIDNAFGIDPNGEPFFSPGSLIEQPAIEEQLDLSYLNINAGVRFTFGGKNNKSIEKPSGQESVNCYPTTLRSPKEYTNKYNLQFDRRPDFEWINISSSVKKYEFQLLKDGDVVYQTQTKKSILKHSKEIEEIYNEHAKTESTEFQWQVVTYFNDCEPEVSKSKSIIFKNRSGQFHDIFDVECVEPFYNADGSVNYTAKIEIRHTSNSSSIFEIQTGGITLDDGSNPIAIQNLRTCGSTFTMISPPINIPPGTTVVYCFDFTVLPGQSIINGRVEGNIEGLQQVSNDDNDLPPCVCEICDEGYILPNNKSEQITAREYVLTDGSSVFQIASDFLLPSASPIREIQAEVISVQHEVNDPQCHTCTQNHSRMGMLFDKGNNRIFGTNTWANNVGTITNAVGDTPGSTQYANEVKWTAQDQALGVDMSTTNTRILTRLAMPQLSSLDCCHSKFKVCVRYTFTDIDCITCDKVVCYEIDTSQNGSGNNGGLDTGIGNQQNQSGTFFNLNNQ